MHFPHHREREHAKLLTYENRQVLAYLYRESEDDALCVALQTWVRVTDEQFRAVVRTQDDESTMLFFAGLDETTLPGVLNHLGMIDEVKRLEAALA